MDRPYLDKIIGSSPISHNVFDIYYTGGACAFPSQGFLSILNISLHQRLDIKIADNFREISALKFSPDENQLAVGESGENASIYILAFNSTFTKIISKTCIETKENGFSCLAFNSKMNRLISIGADERPFLILWDLSYDNPIKLGYYHLSIQPNEVIFNSNCSIAVVAGDSLLKLIQTNFPKEKSPIPMKAISANFGAYKYSTFVDLYFTNEPPFDLYALTYEGTLCFFQKISDPFAKRSKNEKASLILSPIKLNRGQLTALAQDDNIILCGGEKGIISAFRYENGKFKVAGKLVAIPRRVISIRVSHDYIGAAYDDGHLLFWKKADLVMFSSTAQSKTIRPEMTIFNHRGPICKIISIKSSGEIVSCGSDNTIRLWELPRHLDLISNSSQDMLCYYQFDPIDPNFMVNYTGVRAAAYLDEVLIAGLNDGSLQLLDIEDFNVICSIPNCNSITALTSLEEQLYFASGDCEGTVSLYQLDKDNDTEKYQLISSESIVSIPITSLIFTKSSLVASSQLGIKLISLPDLTEIAFYQTTSPILSSSFMEKANLIAAACCDRSLQLLDAQTGKLFMKFILSNNYYPVSIDTHDSGLAIAAAMSDETVLVIDSITGDVLYSFNPSIGIITSVIFHENDLIISSFSGCIARWNLPDSFHTIVEKAKETAKPSPIAADFLASLPAPGQPNPKSDVSEYSEESSDDSNNTFNIRSSMIGFKRPPKCEFEDHQDDNSPKDASNSLSTSSNDIEEEESDDDESSSNDITKPSQVDDVEAPRPPPKAKLDDQLIRSSIWLKKPVNKEDDSIEVINIPNSKPRKKPISIDFNDDDKNAKNDKKIEDTTIKPLKPEDLVEMTDNFVLNSSSSDDNLAQNEKKEEVIDPHEQLAKEIRETAELLKEKIEQAKIYLAESFTDEADIQAQTHLKNLLDSFNIEKQKRDEKKQKMKDFSEKMLEMATNAEKLSKENFDMASSFDPKLF